MLSLLLSYQPQTRLTRRVARPARFSFIATPALAPESNCVRGRYHTLVFPSTATESTEPVEAATGYMGGVLSAIAVARSRDSLSAAESEAGNRRRVTATGSSALGSPRRHCGFTIVTAVTVAIAPDPAARSHFEFRARDCSQAEYHVTRGSSRIGKIVKDRQGCTAHGLREPCIARGESHRKHSRGETDSETDKTGRWNEGKRKNKVGGHHSPANPAP